MQIALDNEDEGENSSADRRPSNTNSPTNAWPHHAMCNKEPDQDQRKNRVNPPDDVSAFTIIEWIRYTFDPQQENPTDQQNER